MLHVYYVKVGIQIYSDAKCSVTKDLIRCRVVKTGNQYLHISPWPESYGPMDLIKAPKSDCFTKMETAQAEADGRANELIARLVCAVNELKAPAVVRDRTVDANAD